jgi:phospholipid-translocating ATPase
MALCHTAIVSKRKVGLSSKYISESEDEISLLTFAKSIGYRFTQHEDDVIKLKINGENIAFEVIGILPFDPVRKMMSMVV